MKIFNAIKKVFFDKKTVKKTVKKTKSTSQKKAIIVKKNNYIDDLLNNK